MEIQTIDLSRFMDGSDRAGVARQVARACEEVGFLIVSAHSLPLDVRQAAFDRSRAFFHLPQEVKARFSPQIKGQQRGYHGVATRSLGRTDRQAAPADLRQSVFLGPLDDHRAYYADLPEAQPAYAPNIIPTVPDGVDAALTALYRAFERLAADMFRVFACVLDLPDDFFVDKMTRHFCIMGCHHYPSLEQDPKPGQLRAGAHTDFGAMTILGMTDGLGGLEARTAAGVWIPVTAQPGEFVINLGDLMQRWTNGRWRSTLHRVVNPPGLSMANSERQSIGFFVHPDYDARIACIESCLALGESPLYPPITAGEHIKMKIDRSHDTADWEKDTVGA
ncbi:MAG TPA: 2-oxoglutarate and iron-dependent oxygenase domain-containing protein [Acetobacteraceae bacterium]|nr:2-oxoglutarate and iron-dependent oxygenase domain-containing protein [Acetobacteraceae bacterium]